MFEAFLDQQGHDYVFEPDWSQIVGRPINTRTDYLVQIDGSSIACEVKGFAPSDKRDRIWDWSKGSFWVGPDDELEPIRRQLKEGAKNLKPLAGAGMPLVIVLADPPRSDLQRTNVALDSFNLVGAMYGNPAVKAASIRTSPSPRSLRATARWLGSTSTSVPSSHCRASRRTPRSSRTYTTRLASMPSRSRTRSSGGA